MSENPVNCVFSVLSVFGECVIKIKPSFTLGGLSDKVTKFSLIFRK